VGRPRHGALPAPGSRGRAPGPGGPARGESDRPGALHRGGDRRDLQAGPRRRCRRRDHPRRRNRRRGRARVAAARFPPEGERGVAGTVRANDYGAAFDAYLADANELTVVVLQLESPRAIENAPAILDVEGVDVAFVGENDLSAALGHPGEKDRDPVREAVERVRTLATDRGVVPGIAARTPEALTERAEWGFRFFLLGSDLGFVREGLAPFE